MRDTRFRISFLFLILLCNSAMAQPPRPGRTVDKVVAVIGNDILLQSEIESQYNQVKDKDDAAARVGDIRCYITDQLLQRKLMLHRAKTDSLKVTEDQVNNEIDRKLEIFTQQFGGVEQLEAFYGKTIRQLKEDFHDITRESLLIEAMQGKITGNVDVTPDDVRKFFKSIPSDSLPYYNAEMEVAQVVIYPLVPQAEERRVKRFLDSVRRMVHSAKMRFETAVLLYSEDKGTATIKAGGRMEMQRADNFVPEYAAATLSLKKLEDTIIQTQFGYHLVQLMDRRGELVETRHILIKPKITDAAVERSIHVLDSIRTRILSDTSFSFEKAAYKYSDDKETRNRGGYLVDMRTSSSHIPVDEIDRQIFFTADKLKPGQISEPVMYETQEGRMAYRIVYLKSRTAPHKANLEEDYPRLKQLATEQKKQEKIKAWVDKQIPKNYVYLDKDLNTCKGLARWRSSQTDLGKK